MPKCIYCENGLIRVQKSVSNTEEELFESCDCCDGTGEVSEKDHRLQIIDYNLDNNYENQKLSEYEKENY